jgi:hypothetical protein
MERRASGKGKKDPRDKRARRNGKDEEKEEEEEKEVKACSLPILRVALVGCGWFSLRAHLPALQRLTKAKGKAYRVELAACVARSDASVKNLRRRLGKSEVKIPHQLLSSSLPNVSHQPTLSLTFFLNFQPCNAMRCTSDIAHTISKCLK